ncbi:MAG: CDP-diacylglycerol--glycerol-3-phosphate 3-phosphatidyltransferase, partial [Rhodocyclaceae bacterium]|nr:CDP-diacylglycerol--glycerol-3-phosphate 3-phosphatidyltransferase [Rhodocyclaceae bacterium]
LAIIIIGREIAISALREWMAELGARSHVAVSVAGKIKTVAQMVAIPLLLYDGRLAGIPTRPPGVLLAWLAAALTIWSMLYYLKKAWPALSARA